MDYYFKHTFKGMVLMIKVIKQQHDHTGASGPEYTIYEVATEAEAQELLCKINKGYL